MKFSIIPGIAFTSLAIGIIAAAPPSSEVVDGRFPQSHPANAIALPSGNLTARPGSTLEKPAESSFILERSVKESAIRIPEPTGVLVIGVGVISFFHRLRRNA